MTKLDKEIKEFLESTDYKNICYFIDHVFDNDITNSCCEQLGYSIGIDIINSKNIPKLKSVIIGSKGEFRVVSNIQDNKIIAETIIFKKSK